MLRLYRPITHDIFKLHEIIEHLVCSVWCEADPETSFHSLVNNELKAILPYKVNKEYSFIQKVEIIYEIFSGLSPVQKQATRDAFRTNNEIEKLCSKTLKPIYLSNLPPIVETEIKSLFEWCYNDLLDKAKVTGDKLDYYKELIEENDFQYCPCCGLIDFESPTPENEVREANDHYLPKSIFPFASVNFQNLVPLCYKCNSDRKSTKDPIENDRKAFYPFANGKHNISIKLAIDETKDIDKLERADLTVALNGEGDKIETWDWLFDISERYNDKVRPRIKRYLRELKNRYRQQRKDNPSLTFVNIIDREIELYEDDKYSDWKFLKIPLLSELKLRTDLIEAIEK